jgi:hypothetical protein
VVDRHDNTYTVRDLFTRQEYDVNVSRVHPFHYDPDRTDPEGIALRDHNAFIIDKIIEFHDSAPHRAQWTAKVRWKGYGPEDDMPTASAGHIRS